jgi:serine/threonine protein kinase
VALKLMTLPMAEGQVERRFRAECRIVGALAWHPNVVTLYDAGVSATGLPYMAMEMIDGGTWGDRVTKGGPCTPSEVVKVGREVVDALGAAHEAGILHRDVKPDNVLISRRGEALLGDFGVATLADGTRSSSGEFKGTFAYCAPELLQGERATPLSDVYGVGATLFTLAVGRSPFAADPENEAPAALVLRIVAGEPPPFPRSVPSSLAHVIGRAMAKHPEDRYPSVAALDEDLRAVALSPSDAALATIKLPIPEPPEGARVPANLPRATPVARGCASERA